MQPLSTPLYSHTDIQNAGPMFEVCKQADCVPVTGHPTLLAQSKPTEPSSTSTLGACSPFFSLIPCITIVSFHCPNSRREWSFL